MLRNTDVNNVRKIYKAIKFKNKEREIAMVEN